MVLLSLLFACRSSATGKTSQEEGGGGGGGDEGVGEWCWQLKLQCCSQDDGDIALSYYCVGEFRLTGQSTRWILFLYIHRSCQC